MKAVNLFFLKARIWMYGPFILIGLLTAIVLLLIYILSNSEDELKSSTYPYGSPFALTDFRNLQAAYLSANGGEASLSELQSVRYTGILETGGKAIPFSSIKRQPWKSLLTLDFKKYELSFIVDGDTVWQRVKLIGKEPVSSLMASDQAIQIRQSGAFFDPVMMLFLFEEGEVHEITFGKWEDREALLVDFQNTDLKLSSIAYIDAKTMYLLAREDRLDDQSTRTLVYSEHRRIAGLLEPLVTTTIVDGELDNRVTIEQTDYNIGTIPSMFQFPEDSQK